MAKTKKPSGLTITRNNDKYTAKWKIADKDYGNGQSFKWRAVYSTVKKVKGKNQWTSHNTRWTPVTIDKTTTSKEITCNRSGYYTNGNGKYLTGVEVWVNGNRKKYTKGSGKKKKTINPSVSDWAKQTFPITAPTTISIEKEVKTWPRTIFTIKADASSGISAAFTHIKYQSVLIKNAGTTDGKTINWDSTLEPYWNTTYGYGTLTLDIEEDSSTLNTGDSYTRFVRACAQGPGGTTAWKYDYQVYALPNRPSISSCKVVDDGNDYLVTLGIDTPQNASWPIEETRAEWQICEPTSTMAPSENSWTTGVTLSPRDETSGAYFRIDDQVTTDTCLFVRAVCVYDGQESPGEPIIATYDGGAIVAGKLATPSGLSVSPGDNNQFTVSADNESSVDGSYLVVRFCDEENPNGIDVGILDTSPKVIQCPAWESSNNVVIKVYAAVGGSLEQNPRADGVTVYDVNAKMTSNMQASGGSIPTAPQNVTAGAGTLSGTIRVTWDWSWAGATRAELSWADHDDAWESTDEPNTYEVSKARTSAWSISGVETGKTWYVRVRLLTGGDDPTYGPYSPIQSVNLSSAPLIPVLDLSAGVITAEGEVTATWGYSTTDGTMQAAAVVAELVNDSYFTIAELTTQQTYTINAANQGWSTGETHLIAVKVVSGSGLESDDWSVAVPVTIAAPVTCSITQSSLTTVTQETTDEQGQTVTQTYTGLTQMPLTVTVEGAGVGGTTTLIIERAAEYVIDRPDEDSVTTYQGETIYINSQTGEAQITINRSELIGRLDDGAFYNLIATVQDDLGQSASQTIQFLVAWSHQAEEPTATVEIDTEDLVAYLTPIAPDNYEQGDTCDIYRLSVDRPQLIYRGASFGTKYVDPYPTIGEFGGHRFVTVTKDGDYITEENQFAWYDTGEDEGDRLDLRCNVIDFAEGRAELTYDVEMSNDWQKDFEETAYLGGSVQGDWNKAVRRSGTLTATAVKAIDGDTVQAMRRLATHAGICHVRTKDGSSYTADVQVGDKYNYATGVPYTDYTLKISRVEPEELDGKTYAEWLATHDEESE